MAKPNLKKLLKACQSNAIAELPNIVAALIETAKSGRGIAAVQAAKQLIEFAQQGTPEQTATVQVQFGDVEPPKKEKSKPDSGQVTDIETSPADTV